MAGASRIEQGWTIAERPSGNGPLLLSFAESGSLHSTLTANGLGLELRDASGFSLLRYNGLVAFDATGRTIAAHFAQRGNGVAIVVDDTTASYPLTIDPWVESATLTAAAGADDDNLGLAVAISADGNTLVAGAPLNAAGGSSRGAVYVYTKPGGGWTTSSAPDATLTAAAGVDYDQLGFAVAISSDGSTIVAGAPFNSAGGWQNGAAYVFVKGANWADSSTPTATLTAAAGAFDDQLGYTVALSSDGSTIVAGAPNAAAGGLGLGAAYVFVKGANWADSSTPSATLTAAAGADLDHLGWAVAISSDDSTIVVGAPNAAAGGAQRGTAYVFTKLGTWADSSAPTATLTAAAGADYDALGYAVAISSDGSTLIAGAPYNAAGGTERGAVYVYTKGANWADSSAPAATLTAAAGADFDRLGYAVAISGDGSSVVAGAPYNAAGGSFGSNRGAAYVYTKPSGGWTTSSAPAKLTAAVGVNFEDLGWAVAISGDGSTVIAGAPFNAAGGNNRGAVYAFTHTADSTNANLSGLTISQGTLSPTFASGTTIYTAAVANSIGSMTVTPTVADSTATVKVNTVTVTSGNASGPISLNVGPNTITVLVTAQDSSTKSYTITVTRAAASTNANLSGLTISQGTLSPTFASGTTSYTADVANSIGSLTVTPTVADSTATVKVNTVTVTSGSASGPISLNVGPNIITVLVTAQDSSTKSYTITVTRAASSNANLSGLTISQGTLSPTFASGTTSYTAAVANSIGSLTVTPTVADSTATIKVNGTTVTSGSASGPITLNVGSNTITVLVTAQDGSTTQSYTTTVTRAAASSNYTIMLPLVVN